MNGDQSKIYTTVSQLFKTNFTVILLFRIIINKQVDGSKMHIDQFSKYLLTKVTKN